MIMESESLTAVSRCICHMGPFLCCFIMSVILFGGHIPIAVGMLDGFHHEAGFHGEGAQHRRRYYDQSMVAAVEYASGGRGSDRHAYCIPFSLIMEILVSN